jgi:molecular chaperone HscB
VAEDETAKVDDPELLMEVLETRETIEEAESEEDLVDMKTTNEGRIDKSVKVLEEAFEKDDIEMAKSEAVKLRYWINIKESLDGWEKGKPVVLQH